MKRRRLSFYVPNTFAVPTAGRGPFLFNAGVPNARPAMNGGLGAVNLPNFANFEGSRDTHRRFDSRAPQPVYRPPASVTAQMAGLGITFNAPHEVHSISPSLPVRIGPIVGTGRTSPIRRNNAGQPPASQQPIGYNPAGGAIYAQRQPGSWRNQQYSTAHTGYGPTYASGGVVSGYDAAGNPVYSTPPPGAYQTGTDAYGNPLYSANPTAAQISSGQAALSTAPGATADDTTATASTSWFSEDSLGLGLNNGVYLGAGALLLYLFMGKRGR